MTSTSERALIIIGHPDVPGGTVRLRCQRCGSENMAQQNTADTVAQLGVRAPELRCWECFKRHPAMEAMLRPWKVAK